eukprot:2138541-Alexandrium_andersonii.AAC.1
MPGRSSRSMPRGGATACVAIPGRGDTTTQLLRTACPPGVGTESPPSSRRRAWLEQSLSQALGRARAPNSRSRNRP